MKLNKWFLSITTATTILAISTTSKVSGSNLQITPSADMAMTLSLNDGVHKYAENDADFHHRRRRHRILKRHKSEEDEEEYSDDDDDTLLPKKKKNTSTKEKVKKAQTDEKQKNNVTKTATETAAASTQAPSTSAPTPAPAKKVLDTKIQSKASNAGVIDHSSEGSDEIDKIDLEHNDGWVSVFANPPTVVVRASLYSFINYNDTTVCDTFNMTLNAVEQKRVETGGFKYHIVAGVTCLKNKEEQTRGVFVLNFVPEGDRLLLIECGHREEGEIVNWLEIKNDIPICMTPAQRKSYIAQPLKHIHAASGETPPPGTGGFKARMADFLSKLEELNPKQVAIAGGATVIFIAMIVVMILYVARRKKAQRDLERTIAGAKLEHAVEDDDESLTDGEASDAKDEEDLKPAFKERKGLMDSTKAGDATNKLEEGSFVNSPSTKM